MYNLGQITPITALKSNGTPDIWQTKTPEVKTPSAANFRFKSITKFKH